MNHALIRDEKTGRIRGFNLSKEEVQSIYDSGSKTLKPATLYQLMRQYHIPTKSMIESERLRGNVEEMHRLYHEEGLTLKQISVKFRCSETTVFDLFKKHGISRRTTSESHKLSAFTHKSTSPPKEILADLYYGKKFTLLKIANLYGVDLTTVAWWMRRMNLPRRTFSDRRKLTNEQILKLGKLYRERVPLDEIGGQFGIGATLVHYWAKKLGLQRQPFEDSQLIELYAQGHSGREIATMFKVRDRFIVYRLKKLGVPIRRTLPPHPIYEGGSLRKDIPVDVLQRLHWEEKLTVKEMSKRLNVGMNTIFRIMHEKNIPIRNANLGKPSWWKKRGLPHPNLGKTAWWIQRGKPHPATVALRPSKPEKMFGTLIKGITSDIRHTGNGTLWIGGLNPDYADDKRKIAIDIHGDYWHSPLLRPNIGLHQTVPHRTKVFKKEGWRYVYFWESEIKSPNAIALIKRRLKL